MVWWFPRSPLFSFKTEVESEMSSERHIHFETIKINIQTAELQFPTSTRLQIWHNISVTGNVLFEPRKVEALDEKCKCREKVGKYKENDQHIQ